MTGREYISNFSTRSAWPRVILAVSSGLMLGLAFPPSPFYTLAYVGLIPFLLLVETLRSTWQFLRYSYVMLFVLHLITLYWAGGFVHARDPWMMGAGAALLIVHPVFYWPSLLLYRAARRKLGLVGGLASLPFFWTSFEYLHSLGEASFPWITLGNSQAYDLNRIQIAEFTSVYGLSFLLLAFNLIAFVLVLKLATGLWRFRSAKAINTLGVLLVIYFLPWFAGSWVISRHSSLPEGETLRVGIVQPNFDPWEKWGEGYESRWSSYDHQLNVFIEETRALSDEDLNLVVWPETAIPFRILLPEYYAYWDALRTRLDSIGVAVFTGLPFTVYYDSATAPVTANRIGSSALYYEDFNSTALIVPSQPLGPVYRKVVLVPFAERIPYAETFRFLIEPLKWNVGIGMWGKGDTAVIFTLPTRDRGPVRFSSLICYESVFPHFVRQFVEQGAEFLVIVTNDSWWGNTSGAYQHAAYASLRAVESRRWIVRAANGGISGLVDPTGRIHQETGLYTVASFTGIIEPRRTLSFYTRHGDVFAIACLCCTAGFIILLAFVKESKAE